ncbi:Serine/threonine-protein kinase BUR1 [Colletotrichum sp. SAR 10_70]|nr:Serine/threonine-protein kinase BUR1 [Colletotrichum sp. SAR 10_70]KAI8164795.1 Serine/threonine-protein kinase BUR1 [Colletotrichum sp. SAR 10_71]KAI8201500.1 Serine/threonine-protein kinase BUR1 [Colletotrichum sp. SAR 10_76]KAI8222664.1 Serine/threonine-protein kinase BUR1 [Colletotrichum sp. SAR 10_86]KAI8248860.1 Serine/threonine-protein kinase BUR1 [Colletotrichum sp. SAR 10_77]
MESSAPNASDSPRTFAMQHQRPRTSFVGCSRITDYDLLGKLGEGTFGEVHRAKSKKTGAHVALKKIIMHHEKDGFPITALREIKLLKLLSHRNVLQLVDMAVEHPQRASDKRKRPIMYMATPYMDHDLSGLLDNPSVTFTEPQIKCYMLQLLEGLRYLHDNHILHRDMKAANLLINNKGILQIADFGLARHYEGPTPKSGHGAGEGKREYTGLVVTRWYRPPELLLHLKKYTTAIDVWGVGEYGSGAISLLKELLRLDWRSRINAADALNHPYFKMAPMPANPDDLPTFEDSHELDRHQLGSASVENEGCRLGLRRQNMSTAAQWSETATGTGIETDDPEAVEGHGQDQMLTPTSQAMGGTTAHDTGMTGPRENADATVGMNDGMIETGIAGLGVAVDLQ